MINYPLRHVLLEIIQKIWPEMVKQTLAITLLNLILRLHLNLEFSALFCFKINRIFTQNMYTIDNKPSSLDKNRRSRIHAYNAHHIERLKPPLIVSKGVYINRQQLKALRYKLMQYFAKRALTSYSGTLCVCVFLSTSKSFLL